jgi:hypothetical protein
MIFFLKIKRIAKIPQSKESHSMRLGFFEIRLFELLKNLSNIKNEVTGFTSRQPKYKAYLSYVNKLHNPSLTYLNSNKI